MWYSVAMLMTLLYQLRRILPCLVLLLAMGCATTGKPISTGLGDAPKDPAPAAPRPSLEDVAAAYTQTCACGERLSNNCAHFLSDAFIRAGYYELKTSDAFTTRCTAKRPIRAQEVMHWFQTQATTFSEKRPDGGTGMWAVYQEKPNRRHVTVIDMNTGIFYGTDDCKSWPVQWFYKW